MNVLNLTLGYGERKKEVLLMLWAGNNRCFMGMLMLL